MSLCLQAEEQGLLKGDLNMAQLAAMSINRAYHQSERIDERKFRLGIVNDIIDIYLQLEHPSAYDEVQHHRDLDEMDKRDPDSDLIAEDMTELLYKVMEMEE